MCCGEFVNKDAHFVNIVDRTIQSAKLPFMQKSPSMFRDDQSSSTSGLVAKKAANIKLNYFCG